MEANLFPQVPSASSKPTEVSSLVYHYAGAGAALGLASNKEIWGSKIQFLNDDQEFIEYINFIIRVITDNIIIDEATRLFSENLIDRIDRVRTGNIYVASFSAEGDKLSQWRGYCPDSGYAMGFDRDLLSEHFTSQGFNFSQAIYQLPRKNDILKPLGDLYEMYRGSGMSTAKEDALDEFFSPFITSLSKEAPRYKHRGFLEENEWRVYTNLTQWNDDLVDIAVVRGGLRPIVKFPLPKITIKDTRDIDIGLRVVRIGPGKDGDLREDAIRILLRRKGIYYDRLTRSLLPYNAR